MITAGVDVGIETVKVVVLKDGKVVSRSTASSGGADRGTSAEKAWQEALKSAGMKAGRTSKKWWLPARVSTMPTLPATGG